MLVHEAIIHFLHAQDVDTVFSLMAEDIMGMTAKMQAEWADELTVVEARHEEWAVAMADGYARVTGDIGVAIVGRGPPVAHVATPLTTARKNGTPLLLVTAEGSLSGTDDVKDFDQDAYLSALADEVISIRDPDVLESKFSGALRRLRSGSGPVVVQIPWDVLDGETDLADGWKERVAKRRPTTEDSRGVPDPDAVEAAVDNYLDSDATVPPLVLAGRGAVSAGAKPAIEDFAKRTNALLATTVRSQGLFSDHPFGIGFVGTFGTTHANQLAGESDFVLAVGCSLNEHTTDEGRLLEDATVVHVDVDPARIDAHTPVDLGVVGDARATVEAVNERLEAADVGFEGKFWTDSLQRRIADSSPFEEGASGGAVGSADGANAAAESDDGRLDPRAFVSALDPILPEDRLVVTDGGHFINWVLDGISIDHPDDYIWTIDFGSIGLGLPVGLGAALATERRTPIIVCGDAGFMMCLQELDTAVRYDIPAIVVVMNDDALGSEYHQLAGRSEYAEAAISETPDIAALATDFGALGFTVRSVADLESLAEHLNGRLNGPVILDCKIDRDVRHRFYDAVHEA